MPDVAFGWEQPVVLPDSGRSRVRTAKSLQFPQDNGWEGLKAAANRS